MKTLSDKTAIRYRGRTAANYVRKRSRQQRWHLENDVVRRMLTDARGSVLDVPVGTGRFLPLYGELGLRPVLGVDSSEEMLRLAWRASGTFGLLRGDARQLDLPDRSFDTVVCVRFLDLLDEPAMLQSLRSLLRVARERIVLTIRLGPRYVLKTNTATHSEHAFKRALTAAGWRIADIVPIFRQGWHVLRLERRGGRRGR